VTRELRVLAITNTYPTAETPGDTPAVKAQIEALAERGVTVDLLHIDRRSRANYVRAALGVLRRALARAPYDLIHGYYGYCGLAARCQWRYPVVVTFRGSDLLDSREARLGRLVARLADGVIVMSEAMRAASGRRDAAVIPFGVDRAVFAPRLQEDARRALGLPSDEALVLFPWDPARPVKRYALAEEVVRRVRLNGRAVRLVAVYDRPHHEVAQYMNACDALLLTSAHEGSPVAVREALASGLPVVSTDVGDVRAMLAGVEDCYVGPADAAVLAERLGWIPGRARADRRRETSLADVGWAADRVLEVYQRVLAEGAPVARETS